MGARLTKRQVTKTRQSIKTGMVVRKLHDDLTGKIELTAGQRKSADILLRYSLPLPAREVNLDVDGSLEISVISYADTGHDPE
jgi:hypothetical protein